MGTQLPLLQRGTAPNFRPISVAAKWLDGSRCQYLHTKWHHAPLPIKGGRASPQLFSAHVWCGQTAGLIKIPLGMQVNLGPINIVLDGDPAPPRQKRDRAPPIFGPCLLSPNSLMDQDETWHGGRPWPRPHCARWGRSTPKKGYSLPIFGPCLLWPNGSMDQDGTWHGGRPWLRPHCVRWGPAPPKRAWPPIFGPCLLCPTVTHRSYC